jgi:hypothetical protein
METICDPCSEKTKTRIAEKYCSDCEEKLCTKCAESSKVDVIVFSHNIPKRNKLAAKISQKNP